MKSATTHILPLAIAFAANASAATIASVGDVTGSQVTDWRTTTTTKTLDIDGNNRYGSYGAVHWGVATANLQTLGSTTPGIAITRAITGTGTFTGAGYTDIDHINNFPADTDAGIAHGIPAATLIIELTGTASTYVGQTVRVGIMHDFLALGERAGDTFKGLSIVQTLGGSGNSGVIPVRGGLGGDGVPELYFFDITNAVAGDRFELRGLNNVGGTSGAAAASGYLGPVSFDVIPEPSVALLGGLGMLCLLRRRRA